MFCFVEQGDIFARETRLFSHIVGQLNIAG